MAEDTTTTTQATDGTAPPTQPTIEEQIAALQASVTALENKPAPTVDLSSVNSQVAALQPDVTAIQGSVTELENKLTSSLDLVTPSPDLTGRIQTIEALLEKYGIRVIE